MSAARRRQLRYGVAVVASSAGGLVVEIVAGRLLAPYVGMSLYTWTAIIAVVLAGLSVGHWIGGRLAGAEIDARLGARRVVIALALAATSTVAVLGGLRLLAGPVLQSGLGTIAAIVVLTALLFLLPSLFVGIVSPILTKLAIDDAPGRHGPVIGRMYALSATGAIVGTLAAGYLFISWIGSTGTIMAVAAMYALLAVWFAVAARSMGAAVAILGLLGGGFGAWGLSLGAHRSPCLVESDYYCIRIDDFSPTSGRASAVMVLDHLGHSISDRDDPALLYTPYLHFVDELAKRRFPDRKAPDSFFIGGGGLTLPRLWAIDDPAAKVVVAEIDPAVTAIARSQMWVGSPPTLRVVHGDARTTLQAMPAEPLYDVIFTDAFRDISVPSHLVTREFHAAVAKRLRPNGFYAINVVEGGRTPRFLFSLVKTLGKVFPAVEVWVEVEGGEFPARGTFMVVAANHAIEMAELGSRRGFERRWRRWPAADLAPRIAAAEIPVLTDDFAPVNLYRNIRKSNARRKEGGRQQGRA